MPKTQQLIQPRKATPSRLHTIIDTAIDNNPYQRAAMAVPPTVAVAASSDGTLVGYPLCAAGALTAAASQVAFYGGVPTPILTNYVAMPVVSVLPSTNGNLGLADLNQWASAIEIMTDSDKVQFIAFTSSAVKLMFQVDGQYVDFTGTAGPASALDTFVKLAFASRKIRRIRVLLPTVPATGPTLPKAMHMTPGASFWKPPQEQVMRVAWAGDSYGETTNSAGSIYPIPNAAWPVLTCELLGLRDCRQLTVGSCGYLSNSAGTRSRLRDQIPRWAAQAPFDLIVLANGYNDASFAAADITAEVFYDLQYIRSLYPTTPVVVLGCQAGNSGPGASQIATELAIASAVAQTGDYLCQFVPVSTDTPTWLNGTGYVGATNGTGNSDVYVDPDHTHPTLAGSEYLAFRSAVGIRQGVANMVAQAG